MAFVNELVSEEDIKKHGLDELMQKYDRWSWRDGRPSTFVHSWTIDRDREVFFMFVLQWQEVGQSGRSQPTNKHTCVVNIRGDQVEVVIEQVPDTWKSFSDSPFRIAWRLIRVEGASERGVAHSELIKLLKEALVTYGYGGARRQVPNTIVTFNF